MIGSGPAGIAAAKAITATGRTVILLDVGGEIEPERMQPFDSLAQSAPTAWPAGVVDHLCGAFPAGIKNVGLKPAFGSLFPYAVDDVDLHVARDQAEAMPSLARGGLSNVWGAAILPFRASDIADWPISVGDLDPHYDSVLRFVPLSGERDELAAKFPLHIQGEPRPLRRSVQAEMVLARLRRNAKALSERGFSFGAARLAVNGEPGSDHHCRYCGLCLHGCPYGSIYKSAQTLAELIRDGTVDYRPGMYVDKVREEDGSVRIYFHDRGAPGHRSDITAARVFVACGALSSTRLILESMGRSEPRRFMDSQYLLMPLITPRVAPVSIATQGNTLAQVFLELEDPSVSAYTVHVQIYAYNDLLPRALAARLPLRPQALERVLHPLFGRLLVAQVSRHSDESPGFVMTPENGGFRLAGERNQLGARHIARSIAKAGRLLGMLPIPGLLQLGLPGKSNHVGGSLPMSRRPGPLDTDVLGRPQGFKRVHVVDSSILPSIPATTVTLTVMANAHRIATTVSQASPDS